MTTQEIRSAYLKFFANRGHVIIPRANLVPKEDATTLFTGSGMQPMIPYLLGAKHPSGTRLTDSQVCFRADDIDEVGDNRHTTSFEMLGNWSLGDYFKKEQIHWIFEFLTEVVKLDPNKLYVTAFIGAPGYDIPKDTEAAEIWQELFRKQGIDADVADLGSEADGYNRGMKAGERIFYYDGSKNWWSRNGGPETTPVGDPCGPDSEMFFRLDDSPHTDDEQRQWGEHCHPNCDCGRFIEIGNNVFMAYRKEAEGRFVLLEKPNIDHGAGLERLAAAAINDPDMFKISLLWPIIKQLERLSGKDYAAEQLPMRIIADHLRAATWLAVDGVVPSNTAQGYVMRRFIRRAIRQAHALGLRDNFVHEVIPVIADSYRDAFPEVTEREVEVINILVIEEKQFRSTLERGLREFEKQSLVLQKDDGTYSSQIPAATKPLEPGVTPKSSGYLGKFSVLTGDMMFKLFDTHGFPVELSKEEAQRRGMKIATDADKIYTELMNEQRIRSRTATTGQFKGGLADHSEMSTKYHTATHLMYKALRIVLGDHVIQRGSNITPERLRFDFSHSGKMTPEQIKHVEDIVNAQIGKDWPMGFREEKTAGVLGKVLGAFGDRYGDLVKIYTVGDPDGEHYSREICGGPHVDHTGVLAEGGKRFRIKKEESSSAGVRRIKAVLE